MSTRRWRGQLIMAFEYDVFLSYSSKDKKTVHALAERLRRDGVRVWLDGWEIEPGDPIGMKTQHGVNRSLCIRRGALGPGTCRVLKMSCQRSKWATHCAMVIGKRDRQVIIRLV